MVGFCYLVLSIGSPECCYISTKKSRKHTSISLHLNARQFKEQIYSSFPKLNGRPYELFKQVKNKKITLLTADTALRIYELGFSGVTLVTLISCFEGCIFFFFKRLKYQKYGSA